MKKILPLLLLTILFSCSSKPAETALTEENIQVSSEIEKPTEVKEEARRIGYESVNFDLIYGLPYQTLQSVGETIDKVAPLMPDRIAFYSYAHVPWVSPGQRSYTEKDLPDNVEKRALYELGLEKFKALGYTDIGMDHFALPHDTLCRALQNKVLHRNFMGYTTCQTDLLIGLGTSAISDAKYAYMQNKKTVETYKADVLQGELAALKGHFLTDEDLLLKAVILSIVCKGELQLSDKLLQIIDAEAQTELEQMEAEGLIANSNGRLKITALGQGFIRNICVVFDQKLRRSEQAREQVFSKAI